jgi:hypothetical protein
MNFGKLSSSIGGGNGLAGGSGMAGGIGQQFKQASFDGSKPGGIGQVLAMGSRTTAKSSARPMSVIARGNGAMGQLQKSSAQSIVGRNASNAESASYHGSQAFTAAPASQGSTSVGGQGAGGGTSQSAEAAEGPINPPAAADTTATNPNQAAPSTGTSSNVTPWQSTVVMAQTLLMVASGLILLLSMQLPILKDMAGTIVKGLAAGLAATAAAMGVMIMQKYGQQTQGMIITTGGAITAAAAVYALVATKVESWIMVLAGVAGMAASVGSMLVKSNI